MPDNLHGDHMSMKDLIDQANALPVEERALVIESLLKGLNTPEPDIDKRWGEIASRRLSELQSGTVQGVSAEAVFERMWKRLKR